MKYAYMTTITLPGPRPVDSCCQSTYLDRVTPIHFNKRKLAAAAIRLMRTPGFAGFPGGYAGAEFRTYRMPRSVYGKGGWDTPTFRHASEEITLTKGAK